LSCFLIIWILNNFEGTMIFYKVLNNTLMWCLFDFVDWIDEEQNDEWGNFNGLENKKIRCAFVRKVCYIKIFKNK